MKQVIDVTPRSSTTKRSHSARRAKSLKSSIRAAAARAAHAVVHGPPCRPNIFARQHLSTRGCEWVTATWKSLCRRIVHLANDWETVLIAAPSRSNRAVNAP